MSNPFKYMSAMDAWRVASPTLKIAAQEDLEDMAYPDQEKSLDYTGKGLALAELTNALSRVAPTIGSALTKFNTFIPIAKPLLSKAPYLGQALTAYQILDKTSKAPNPIENYNNLIYSLNEH